MKRLMEGVIYLQMRKIELKLNFFNDLEKLLEGEKCIVKSMESEVISDKLKTAMQYLNLEKLTKEIRDLGITTKDRTERDKNEKFISL